MPIHTLRPDGDGSISNWVGSYSAIDDDPDSPDDGDSVYSVTSPAANSAFFTLTSGPSDFLSASSVAVRVRSKSGDGSPMNLYAQLFKSDESTALTSSAFTEISDSSYSTVDISLPIIGTPSKADFDGARLKVWSEPVIIYPDFWNFTPVDQTNFNKYGSGLTYYYGSGYHTSSTLRGPWEFNFPMRKGTWNISWIYRTASDYGIFDISLDGSSIATNIDLYSSSTTPNVLSEISNIVVSSSGIKPLRFTSVAKNSSSSDYKFSCQLIVGVRVGD